MPRVPHNEKPRVYHERSMWVGIFKEEQAHVTIHEADEQNDILLDVSSGEKQIQKFITRAQARRLGMLLLEIADE